MAWRIRTTNSMPTAGRLTELLLEIRSSVDKITGNLFEETDELSENYGPISTIGTIGRRYLKGRRFRKLLLDASLTDADWLILIDLYNHDGSKDISVSSACIASGLPPTTALRHIRILGDLGLVRRYCDSEDRRVIYLTLTTEARQAVEAYLGQLGKLFGMVVLDAPTEHDPIPQAPLSAPN